MASVEIMSLRTCADPQVGHFRTKEEKKVLVGTTTAAFLDENPTCPNGVV